MNTLSTLDKTFLLCGIKFDVYGRWEESVKLLIWFVKKYNRLPSIGSKRQISQLEKKIGNWCCTQRAYKRNETLSQEKQRCLESVYGWKWDIHDEQWLGYFNKLKEFVRNNHRLPKGRSNNLKEKCIGNWCTIQKQHKRDNTLCARRKKMLESIDYWGWKLLNKETRWLKTFKKLKVFSQKFSLDPVGRNSRGITKKISMWMHGQKLRKKKGKLSKKRQKLLETIRGWHWQDKFVGQWEVYFNELKKFIKKSDRFPKSNSKNKNERILAAWVNTQKKYTKEYTYNSTNVKKRQKLLETIKGWTWNYKEKKWISYFNELKKFLKKHKVFPQSYRRSEKEKSLASWYRWQKIYKKKNRLSKERQKLLETIPSWQWEEIRPRKWLVNFEQAKTFIKQHKRFPKRHSKSKKEMSIASWFFNQKQYKKRKFLPKERQKLLESFSGWSWEGNFENLWANNFNKLKNFVKINSRLPVSSSKNKEEKNLALWCVNQRKRKNNKKLPLEKCRLLEAVEGWIWVNLLERYRTTKWNANLDKVKIFSRKYRYLPMADVRKPKDPKESFLGKWVCTQRRYRKTGQLSKERQKLLEGISNWGWVGRENITKKASIKK